MSGQSKWKGRLPTRIYDYNYKVSENYYHPQSEYMNEGALRRERKETPPKAQSYAERFADHPFYGSTKGLPYNQNDSATYEPLVNPHGKSASRASSLLKERGGSRAKSLEPERSSSAFDDKWDDIKKDMKKAKRFDLDFDDDFRRKPKEDLRFDEEYNTKMMPIRTKAASSIKEELNKIDEKLASRPKRVSHEEYRGYDSDLNPGRRTVTREEQSYSSPGSNTSVTRSSYKTSSSSSSSKPSRFDVSPPSRPKKVSHEEYRVYDSDFNPGRRRVTREEQSYTIPSSNKTVTRSSYKTSSSYDSSSPFKPPSGYKFESVTSSSSNAETEPRKSRLSKAYDAREARHAREEDLLAKKAHRLVDKLSDRGFDKFGDRAFENLSVSRFMRSTSLDPF